MFERSSDFVTAPDLGKVKGKALYWTTAVNDALGEDCRLYTWRINMDILRIWVDEPTEGDPVLDPTHHLLLG